KDFDVEAEQFLFSEVAARYTRLVGYDDNVKGGLKGAKTFNNAGKYGYLVDLRQVMYISDQYTIPVKENCNTRRGHMCPIKQSAIDGQVAVVGRFDQDSLLRT